jgi:hypothetical protein
MTEVLDEVDRLIADVERERTHRAQLEAIIATKDRELARLRVRR